MFHIYMKTETAKGREGFTVPILRARIELSKEKAHTEVGLLSEKVSWPLSVKRRLREKPCQLCAHK